MATQSNVNISLDGETKVEQATEIVFQNPVQESVPTEHVQPPSERVEDEKKESFPKAYAKGDKDDFYEQIEKLMEDEDTPLVDICRLINRQLLVVGKRVRDQKDNGQVIWQQKQVEQELKVLTALQKGVTDSDMLSKRDTLNFDGAKFQFVFDELLSYYELAVKQALGKSGEAVGQSIIKHFRDIIAMKEGYLRRETAKIGTPSAEKK